MSKVNLSQPLYGVSCKSKSCKCDSAYSKYLKNWKSLESPIEHVVPIVKDGYQTFDKKGIRLPLLPFLVVDKENMELIFFNLSKHPLTMESSFTLSYFLGSIYTGQASNKTPNVNINCAELCGPECSTIPAREDRPSYLHYSTLSDFIPIDKLREGTVDLLVCMKIGKRQFASRAGIVFGCLKDI